MNRHWLPLAAATAPDAAVLGGKGANLVRLLQAGYPVPPGFVLTAGLFARCRGRADAAERVAAVLRRALGGDDAAQAWAVRSSGVDEDAADASFAGQHATLLDVRGIDALVDAVLHCWASADGPTAAAYRLHRSGGTAAMAVVVQRLVPAVSAGVMFTRHPVRPDRDHIVVEAVAGLGESLVSGHRQPDRLELDRHGRRLAADWAAGRDTSELDAIGDARWAALAAGLEAAFGQPLDVEWAWDGRELHLLQARPITTCPPTADVWSRTWGDEFWAEATTPLMYDYLGRWIREDYFAAVARICGYHQVRDVVPFERRHSHIYFNARYMWLLLPMFAPALRQERFFLWLPPLWRARLPGLPQRRWQALWGSLRARWFDREASILRHHRRLDAYVEQVRSTLAAGLRDDMVGLADAALWRRLERADALGRAHFRFIRWGLGAFLFPLQLALGWIGVHWAGDADGQQTAVLSASPAGTRTAAANRALAELAKHARAAPAVAAALQTPDGPPDVAVLQRLSGGPAFVNALSTFLNDFGHRGTTREIRDPRWLDQPRAVLGLVAACVSGDADPGDRPEAAAAKHAAAEAPWFDAIRARRGGWWKVRLAGAVLNLTRAYVRYREDQRFALDYVLTELRFVVLEVARRLVERRRLNAVDDVFFLTGAELERLWFEHVPAPDDLEDRRQAFERDRAELPAAWFVDGVAYGTVADVAAGGDLRGTPAAGGRGSGPARVVRTPAELCRVRPGDVLVAPNTDPGWTPVFPLLAAVVLETGGILSHGAIVAREYGIPAVTGVSRATARVGDGEWLTVDGATGQIDVGKAPAANDRTGSAA